MPPDIPYDYDDDFVDPHDYLPRLSEDLLWLESKGIGPCDRQWWMIVACSLAVVDAGACINDVRDLEGVLRRASGDPDNFTFTEEDRL